MDASFRQITFLFPGGHFRRYQRLGVQPPVQALAIHDVDLRFGHIQPTAVLGGVSKINESLVVDKLDRRFADLGEVHLFDEAHRRLQRAVNVRLVRAHLADTELRLLPEVVLPTLGDRHVELGPYPRLNAPEHGPLVLE